MQQDRTRARRGLAARARLALGLCLSTSMLAGAAPARAQTDTQRAAARSAAQEGDKAFKEQRYEDAAMYFARAESIMHAPTLLLFLARSQAKLGQYVKARESYFKIMRERLAPDAPNAFVAAKKSAVEEAPEVEKQIATLTIQVPDVPIDSLKLNVDQEQVASAIVGVPYPIDPGPHSIVARADGYESAETRVILAAGQTSEATLTLAPIAVVPKAPTAGAQKNTEPRTATDASVDGDGDVDAGSSSGMLIGGYVGLGVGVIGVSLGAVFAIQRANAQTDADAFWSECLEKSQSGCEDPVLEQKTEDLDAEVAAKGTQAWVAFGVGAAGLATGITLLVLSRSDTRTAQVRPYVSKNGFGVTGRF